jgi:hypothetical protein
MALASSYYKHLFENSIFKLLSTDLEYEGEYNDGKVRVLIVTLVLKWNAMIVYLKHSLSYGTADNNALIWA